jgi:hypothetical protein
VFGKAIVYSLAYWINSEIYTVSKTSEKLLSKLYYMYGDIEIITIVADIFLVNTSRCCSLYLICSKLEPKGKQNEKLWVKEFAKAYLC